MKNNKTVNILTWVASVVALVLAILCAIFALNSEELFTQIILFFVAALFVVLAGMVGYLAYVDTFKVIPGKKAEHLATMTAALLVLFGGLLALEWGAYLLLDFFYAYTIAKEKGMKFFPVEVILYPAFHFAYGYGSLVGIANLPKFLKAEKENKIPRMTKRDYIIAAVITVLSLLGIIGVSSYEP